MQYSFSSHADLRCHETTKNQQKSLPGRVAKDLRNGFWLFLVFPLGILGGFVTPRSIQSQERENEIALKDRFIHEAPSQWEEYTKRVSQLQGSFIFQVSQTLKNMKAYNTYNMKKNEKCKLLNLDMERTIEGKRDYRYIEVFATNPNYAFALRRMTPDAPWGVTQWIDLSNNSLPSGIENHFKRFEHDVITLISIRDEPLVNIIRQTVFRVLRCRKITRDGEELAEVTFDYPHEIDEHSSLVTGGTLILNPQRLWCLHSYQVQAKTPHAHGTMNYRLLEFEDIDQSLRVPKRSVADAMFFLEDGSTNRQELKLDYNLAIPNKLSDDDEFTFSAFGLPEPVGLGKRTTPWYLWAALVGMLCLSLAAVFRWLARRAK